VAYYASAGTTISDGSAASVYGGDFVISSDRDLKNVTGNITNALDNVIKLNGVRYTWNDIAQEMGFSGKEEIGVLAQEVEAVYPEFVLYNNDTGYKMVSYSRLVAVLIEAVKELSAKVDKLEAK
jgi:hypothetical protein